MGAERLMTRWGTLVSVIDGPPDSYGNPTQVEVSSPVQFELQQQRRDETGDPASWQVGTWRLFMPAGTDAAGADRFIDDSGGYGVTGDVFEFDGPPWEVWHPARQVMSHVEATVKRVT